MQKHSERRMYSHLGKINITKLLTKLVYIISIYLSIFSDTVGFSHQYFAAHGI